MFCGDYKHTYVASLTTTLVKLDQSVITSRLAEQSKSFQALFGNIVGQLDGG
jgi:hypothetical protein